MKRSMHNNHRRNIYFKREEERHRSNNNYILSCKVSQLAELLTVVFSKKKQKNQQHWLITIYIQENKNFLLQISFDIFKKVKLLQSWLIETAFLAPVNHHYCMNHLPTPIPKQKESNTAQATMKPLDALR